jgi:hypothetical protein
MIYFVQQQTFALKKPQPLLPIQTSNEFANDQKKLCFCA